MVCTPRIVGEETKALLALKPELHLRVSLDGPRAEIHEAHRLPGSFDRVIDNLGQLVGARGFPCRSSP